MWRFLHCSPCPTCARSTSPCTVTAGEEARFGLNLQAQPPDSRECACVSLVATRRSTPLQIRKTTQAGGHIISKLHLIDLAGSEDNRRTDNVGTLKPKRVPLSTKLGTTHPALPKNDLTVVYVLPHLGGLVVAQRGADEGVQRDQLVFVCARQGKPGSTLHVRTRHTWPRNCGKATC